MTDRNTHRPTTRKERTAPSPDDPTASQPPQPTVCPVCGGRLVEIRGKLQCARCHRICETCCEGGRG